MDNPPEGMTSKDIRNMSEDELLDMDFFLNEDDLFADEAGVEGFISSNERHLVLMPDFVRAIFIHCSNKIGISYYIKIGFAYSAPLPLNLEGLGGFFFFLFPA